jgi:hypothetical protein
MQFPKNFWAIFATVFISVCAASQTARQALVQRVSVANDDPLQVQVQTSAPVTPQAQIISSPERLVIDVPGAEPSSSLHNVAVNRGELKRVRVGVFSVSPLVTRIVLDLNAPQWYRITPSSSGFTVSLGADRDNADRDNAEGLPSDNQLPTIGWVSAKVSASSRNTASIKNVSAQRIPFVVENNTAPAPQRLENGVSVYFANGILEIHARNATLSEVLFQVQKQTGAEISIPSGTEQEHVGADFGPGPANEVLADLLNGSDLNFVVVGSETDPNRLRSVILSRKSSLPESSAPVAQPYTPPPPDAGNNIEPPDMVPMPPTPDENMPQPAQPVPEGSAPPPN